MKFLLTAILILSSSYLFSQGKSIFDPDSSDIQKCNLLSSNSLLSYGYHELEGVSIHFIHFE
jgi:hypothetical protein